MKASRYNIIFEYNGKKMAFNSRSCALAEVDEDFFKILNNPPVDGNSGNTTHIEDKEQIQHIIGNLNDVEVKRSKLSAGYTGYSFKVTIYLSDGNEADDWNNFIINSEDTIRKDPFFYSVTKGNIDYSYIENIVE